MSNDKHDEKAEGDTAGDAALADSRDTGGVQDEDAADQAVTTGPTPKGEYVGRVAGDDIGYAEETGAERRAEG